MAILKKREPSPELQPQPPKLRLYRNDSVEFEDSPGLLRDSGFGGSVLGDLIYPDVVSRQACFWGGLVFGLIGALESFYPGIAGLASASRYHSLFYLMAGGMLILPAIMLPPRQLNRVSTFMGVALAAVAFFGFLMGSPPQQAPEADRFHWAAVPGLLELGTKDHILLGVVGLLLMLVSVRSEHKREERGRYLDMSFK